MVSVYLCFDISDGTNVYMKVKTNLLTDIKSHYLKELTEIYDEQEALSLLNLLIEHFFGLSRTEQALQKDFRLNETELLKIHFAIKELKNEKPIQYIIGETEFYGLTIKVNPSVLIPRPETEELVDHIIKENKSGLNSILDIGTGSGCIALALKKAFPEAEITAIDMSKEALAIARKNAQNLKLEIALKETDILDELQWDSFKTTNLIVSNPPYVTEKEKESMKNNVLQHEPHQALFVKDTDPLIFYRKIGQLARKILLPQGQLWFEINEAYEQAVTDLLINQGFATVDVKKDIFGKDRMVKAVI